MFESVHVKDTTIMLTLKQAFLQQADSLLDRLSKYLRARIPEVKQVHWVHKDGRNIY